MTQPAALSPSETGTTGLRNPGLTLTRRGWSLTGGAIVLIGIGRILGVIELIVLGAGIVGLLAGAVVSVALIRPRLTVARQIEPARPVAATPTQVNLSIRSERWSSMGTVLVADCLNGVGQPERVLPSVAVSDELRPHYQLPGLARGRQVIGPLTIRVIDPFGLASRRWQSGPQTVVLVYPRVQQVRTPPSWGSDDLRPSAYRPSSRATSGEDFVGLRAFQSGDDLRRVHWPSSARRGELLVRQLETPAQGRVTVRLDTTIGASGDSDDAAFEASVSAAASILTASARDRLDVRLTTTAGFDSGFGPAGGHLDALVTRLALIQSDCITGTDASLGARTPIRTHGPVQQLARPVGAVVMLTTRSPAAAFLDQGQSQATTYVVFSDDRRASGPGDRVGPRLVRVTNPSSFASSWNSSMDGPSR